jgi:phosphoribosyl-ATP pyrophosphohydrolase
MNINDIKSERPEGDKLKLIFERQGELKDKYHKIEISQGVGYGILGDRKFDINETRSQCLIKDMAWRVVEEITEAHACHKEREAQHFIEELADAMHFLTELMIQCDISPGYIVNSLLRSAQEDMLDIMFYTRDQKISANPYWTIQHLGLAMNCLKQKPWKQTHVLTDIDKFELHLIDAYKTFCKHMSVWVTSDQAFDFYFKKSKVNDFRIRSNY